MNEREQVGDGGRPEYDLDERTAVFGEVVIEFVRRIKLDAVTSPLVTQVVRASTSIGANYDEADEAPTKKDFRYRISVCKKEARETGFFVRMIVRAVPELRDHAKPVWQEAKELHLIFAKIYRGK